MIILTDVDTVVYMHANSVDITGVIKIEDAQGNKIPQAGVIVDLVISAQSGINNIVLVDTTDETGTYSFNNLPERADSYTLTTRAFERDGVKFDRRQLPPMDNLKIGGTTLSHSPHCELKQPRV